MTGGEYHHAGTAEALRSVYQKLGSRLQVQTRDTELTGPAGLARGCPARGGVVPVGALVRAHCVSADHVAGRSRLLPLLCLLAMQGVHAARPMATDDTATAAAGECQIEAWGERVDDERSQVLAPACGLTDTLELDAGFSRIQGGSATLNAMVLGLKWVPTGAAWDTALGTVRLGLLGGVFWTRTTGDRWKTDSAALVGLSGLEFSPDWNLYANFVTTRNLDTGKHVNGLRVALAWQPDERVTAVRRRLALQRLEQRAQRGFPAVGDPRGAGAGCGHHPLRERWPDGQRRPRLVRDSAAVATPAFRAASDGRLPCSSALAPVQDRHANLHRESDRCRSLRGLGTGPNWPTYRSRTSATTWARRVASSGSHFRTLPTKN